MTHPPTASRRRRAGKRSSVLLLLLLPGILPWGPPGSVLRMGPEPLRAQGVVPGADHSMHPEAARAISRLRSPYCPGLMLEVCPSPQAARLRDSIRVLAEGGMTSAELVEWMLADYGEEYRAVPEPRGAGLLAWLVPPLALLLGAVGLAIAIRRLSLRRADRAEEGPPGELSEGDQARIRDALRELETLEEPIL